MQLYALIFFFGLFVGSFINVLALRYKPGEKIFKSDRVTGRSHCPYCKKTLSWYELIPLISFLLQRGKCRSCKKALSLRYPVVEVVAGIVGAATICALTKNAWLSLTPSAEQLIFAGLWLTFIYALLLMSLIDLKYSIIPDRLNVFLFINALAIAIVRLAFLKPEFNGSFFKSYASIFGFSSTPIVALLVAVLFAAGFFAIIIAVTKGRGMGMGDLKLAPALALAVGWPDIILLISSSFIIGSLISLPLLIQKKKKLKQAVPFGPFLALALFATITYGGEFIRWYFSLI